MATLEQIAEALRKADAAGNVEDARRLAEAYRQMQAQQSDEAEWADPGVLVPIQWRKGHNLWSGEPIARWAVPQVVTDLIGAVEAPGKALQGEYGLELDPITMQPSTVTDEMFEDAMGTAGLGLTEFNPAAKAVGTAARPAAGLMSSLFSRPGGAAGQAGAAIGGSARNVIQRSLAQDNIKPSEVARLLTDVGPNSMLADLGPNLRARAAAIATMPGEGARTVTQALAARRAGSNARIIGDVNDTIGPPVVPSQAAAGIQAGKQALSPHYEALFQQPGVRAVDSSDIALTLDSLAVNERGAAQGAAKKVRDMLNVTGTNELDPAPYTLLKTRQAIDGMLATEVDPNAIRVLTQARNEIDDVLAPAVPGLKEVDAQFAELARQGEALQTGQQVLDTGRTAPRPSEVEDLMQSGALPQGQQIGPSAVPLRLSQGARAEIDRIIGTNVRDINAMKRILAGEGSWNRDRLASIFGQEKADRLLGILEREATFDATEQMALAGSRTQVLKAAQDDIAGAGPKPNPVRSAANFKFGDAVAELLDRGIGGFSAAGRSATNEQIARALISGADDPALLSAIAPKAPGLAQHMSLFGLRAGAVSPELGPGANWDRQLGYPRPR